MTNRCVSFFFCRNRTAATWCLSTTEHDAVDLTHHACSQTKAELPVTFSLSVKRFKGGEIAVISWPFAIYFFFFHFSPTSIVTFDDVHVTSRLLQIGVTFSVYPQKFGHWYWHPEFPRGLGGEPAAARRRGLNVDGLLVRTECLGNAWQHFQCFNVLKGSMCKIYRDWFYTHKIHVCTVYV